MDISWECTRTCGCENFFKPLYHLLNSSVFVLITNSTKQLGTFMTISHGKGSMYFSWFCFLVLEFFAWQIVIWQEWENFINIWEWPSSALRKQYLVLIISDYSHKYCHLTVYGSCMMKKMMKKSQYQIIVLCILQICFFSSFHSTS